MKRIFVWTLTVLAGSLLLLAIGCGSGYQNTSVEEIVENSGTPFFYFKDIDENKPAGAIKIRVETIAYFLKRYHESMLGEKEKRAKIEAKLTAYRESLEGATPVDQTLAAAL